MRPRTCVPALSELWFRGCGSCCWLGRYDLAKVRARPTSMAASNDGSKFVVTASDAHVRVFKFATGKLYREYDERVQVFEAAQREGALKIDTIDFGRRAAFEKELQVWLCHLFSFPAHSPPNAQPPSASAHSTPNALPRPCFPFPLRACLVL